VKKDRVEFEEKYDEYLTIRNEIEKLQNQFAALGKAMESAPEEKKRRTEYYNSEFIQETSRTNEKNEKETYRFTYRVENIKTKSGRKFEWSVILE